MRLSAAATGNPRASLLGPTACKAAKSAAAGLRASTSMHLLAQSANAHMTPCLQVDLATPGVVKIKPEGGDAATVVFPDLSFCKVVAHVINKVGATTWPDCPVPPCACCAVLTC
jgi:hypothetical protein